MIEGALGRGFTENPPGNRLSRAEAPAPPCPLGRQASQAGGGTIASHHRAINTLVSSRLEKLSVGGLRSLKLHAERKHVGG